MSITSDKALSEIKKEIISGSIPFGYRLTEAHLAEKLQMSRTPIREALKKLVEERWLEYTPNIGMKVREWEKKDILDNFHVRKLLECEAVNMATLHITAQGIETLKVLNAQLRAMAQLKSVESIQQMTEINLQFHQLIWESANNKVLNEMLVRCISIPTMVNTYQKYGEQQMLKSFDEHDQMIIFFEKGNQASGQKAAQIMSNHLENAANIFR